MRQHLIELTLFSTYAELRAERARSYLGLIWWVLDPAMQMAVWWLLIDVILGAGGPEYLPSLLIGVTLWQWMKSCMIHGGYAIWSNLNLVRQVRLPPLVFPIVAMLSDTVKFFYILAVLLMILWLCGYPPNPAYFGLVPLFAAALLLSAGIGFVIAALVPLLPDLRFVIEQVLNVVMYLSGVVFMLTNIQSPQLRAVLSLNPIAVIMDAARGVLMRAEWPNWVGLGKAGLIALVACVAGALIVARLAPRYPKLAT